MFKRKNNNVLSIKVLREIKNNFKTYLSVILIATLAVTLFTGIFANYKNFDDRLDNIYSESNMCDGIIMTKAYDKDIEDYLKTTDVYYEKRLYIPSKFANTNVNLVTFSSDSTLNKPFRINKGTDDNSYDSNSVLVDENFLEKNKLNYGDEIAFDLPFNDIRIKVKLTGTIQHPESLENSTYNPNFIYIGYDALKAAVISYYNLPFVTDAIVDSVLSEHYNQFIVKGDEEIFSSVKEKFSNSDNYIYSLKRSELPSNITIEADVKQAQQLLYIFPVIFYLVAILIILTSISQLINRESKNIGILKALGFSKFEILRHYTNIFILLSLIGSVLGIILGPLIVPNVMQQKYNILYQLPEINLPFFRPEYLYSVLILVVITALTSLFACFEAMNKVPAASLRGDNAVKMHNSVLSKFKWFKKIPLSILMALRNMKRKISRTVMVIVGVLGCSALLVCGFGIEDTINYGLDLELKELIPFDVSVTYASDSSKKDNVLALENVTAVDEYAKYSVNVEFGNLISSYLYVLPEKTDIFTPQYDEKSCLISKKVSKDLNVKIGDEIAFVLNNQTYKVEVTNIVDFCISQGVFISTLHKSNIDLKPTGAWVRTADSSLNETTAEQLNSLDGISSVSSMAKMQHQAENTISSIKVMTYTVKIFAILLAVVVLYNLALLNFKERVKDIATLKVLGFSKFEVASSFVIEIIFLTFVGSLVGLLFGYPLLVAVLSINETPLISYIYHINPISFIWTVIITCGSSLIINLFFAYLTKKVQMVESLKSVE